MTEAEPNILAAHAEYRESDYRFPRQRQDWLWVPLETSAPPIRSWGREAATVLGFILFLIGAFVIPAIIVWAHRI